MRLLRSVRNISGQPARSVVIRIRKEHPEDKMVAVTILWGRGTVTFYRQDLLDKAELIRHILGLIGPYSADTYSRGRPRDT